MEVTEGQRVERVDYENDGTPAYQGAITRIERDGDETTYWITWDGTDAPDPHGSHAFRTIDTSTVTAEQIAEARDWIADCTWRELDEDDVPELTNEQVIKGIQRHYDGGWSQFVADSA